MKRLLIFLGVLFTLLLISDVSNSQSPMGAGSSEQGSGSESRPMYNPSTVETIRGEVISVEKVAHGKGIASGIHLTLKTDKETILVHLGPSWYIENQDTEIKTKDQIEVKGSRITYDGKQIIIAAEVTLGSQILKLRDESGFPVWSGWRKRQ